MEQQQLVVNGKKGQTAIMGLLFAFMLIATFSVILSPLMDFVGIGINATANVTHGNTMRTVINALPLFIAIVVLIAVVALITGRQT